MDTSPYSIYVDKRPLRVAYLISNKSKTDQIDAIIDISQDKWGGRFYQIIRTDGEKIDPEWFQLLMSFDPDIIQSQIKLGDKLVKRIDRFISPYAIVQPRDTQTHNVSLHDEPISVLPTIENTKQVSRAFFDNPKLVLFDVKSKNKLVKSFILQNFGVLDNLVHIDKAVKQNDQLTFTIKSLKDLGKSLDRLSTFDRFVYPIQLCAMPNTQKGTEHNHLNEMFTVVLGDTVEDRVFAWDRILEVPQWKRTDINTVWLPLSLANDLSIRESLKKWLKRLADPNGSTSGGIVFLSKSLKKAQIDSLAKGLTEGSFVSRYVRNEKKKKPPEYKPYTGRFFGKTDNMDLFRGTGENEQIVLNEPMVQQGVRSDEHWMADVYIQYRPEVYGGYYINRDFWWQLPKRNELAQQMFHKASRINLDRFPSILMKRGDSRLSIRILDDLSIFSALIVGENRPAYTSDPRTNLVSRPYDDIGRSDKGKYLTGLLGLFRGLPYAAILLQERYWRNMFSLLSNQDPRKDINRKTAVTNKVNGLDTNLLRNPAGREYLADYILQVAKDEAAFSKEYDYRRFSDEAEKEVTDYNKTNKQGQTVILDHDDLKREINNLLELRVLLLGVRPKCPSCGSSYWYHIDDTHQHIECSGCGTTFSLKPEERWYYKLNSLVETAHSRHGLTPVILVLGQLLNDSHSSYLMAPCLDLYEKGNDRPVTDLDIVSVKDGRFIIGEVKQSVGLFKKKDFDTMIRVAEKIQPDEVIFASLGDKPNAPVIENLKRAAKRLAPLGINVKWESLPYYFFDPTVF